MAEEAIKLFVGRVPKEASEHDFASVFTGLQGCQETILLKKDGTSKGCGFVKFGTLGQAIGAIRAVNGQVVMSETLGPLKVSLASGEDARLGIPVEMLDGTGEAKLFVGGLPKGSPAAGVQAELTDLFSQFGAINEVVVMSGANDECKGAGFVKMADPVGALEAIEALDKKQSVGGAAVPLEVRFARNGKGGGKGQQAGQFQPAAAFHPQPQPPMHFVGQPRAPPRPPAAAPPPPTTGARSLGQWTEYVAANGTPYYCHNPSGMTQWEQPLEFRAAPPRFAPY
mmetsp:Transcript_15915/g.34652  ORF Transcript_15915/g.34652 Transcript_15915/m.34652 type:complete len:283 (+) Transcript_15915:48-896(+)